MMSKRAAGLIVGVIALIFAFVAEFTLYRIMERFASDPLADSRIPLARNTFTAAIEYMPFGSGIGSFVPVYGMYEQPGDTMVNAFANHAHNDILEVPLESGIFGIALMGFLTVWVMKRAVEIWRIAHLGTRVDLWLARGATLIIILLSFHSLVDYPLRTGAVMAIMAFACGLLVAPFAAPDGLTVALQESADKGSAEKRSHRMPGRAGAAPPSDTAAVGSPRKPDAESWTKNITWPAAWRKGRQGSGCD